MVSNLFKDLCMREDTSFPLAWKIYNFTTGYDLTEYLVHDSFSLNIEKDSNGVISSDSSTFTLKFKRNVLLNALSMKKIKDITGEEDLYKQILFSDNRIKDLKGTSEEPVSNYIDIVENRPDYLVREDDYIYITASLQDEETTVFQGRVSSINKDSYNLKREFTVKVNDSLKKGVKKKFEKNYSFTDFYLINNQMKEKSIGHIVMKLAGFEDNEYLLEDAKFPDGEYIKIPHINFNYKDLILNEILEIKKALNANFKVDKNGIIKLSNPYLNNKSFDNEEIYFKFNSENIKNTLQEIPVKAQYDGITLNYQYIIPESEEMEVFILSDGKQEHIKEGISGFHLDANENSVEFEIKYYDQNGYTGVLAEVNENFEAKFSFENGEEANITIETFFNTSGGTVKFKNPFNQRVYIDKFVIKGKPLRALGREYTYSEVEEAENTLTLSSKYIQSDKLANLAAKYNYFLLCNDYKTYSINSTSCVFLDTNTKILLEHIDYSLDSIIEKITFSTKGSNILLKEYIPFDFKEAFENYKGYVNNTDLVLAFNATKDNFLELNPDIPNQVRNLVVSATAFGFEAFWDKLERADIQYYKVSVYNITDNKLEYEKFVSANLISDYLSLNKRYSVKVCAISFKGIEGVFTVPQEIIPTGVTNNVIQGKIDENKLNLDHSTNDLFNKIDEEIQGVKDGSFLEMEKDRILASVWSTESLTDEEIVRFIVTYEKDRGNIPQEVVITTIEELTNSYPQFATMEHPAIANIAPESRTSLVQLLSDKIDLVVKKNKEEFAQIEVVSDAINFRVKNEDKETFVSINENGIFMEGGQIKLKASALEVGENFRVDSSGNLEAVKIKASSIQSGIINGENGQPIILGNDTEVHGSITIEDDKSLIFKGKNGTVGNLFDTYYGDGSAAKGFGLQYKKALNDVVDFSYYSNRTDYFNSVINIKGENSGTVSHFKISAYGGSGYGFNLVDFLVSNPTSQAGKNGTVLNSAGLMLNSDNIESVNSDRLFSIKRDDSNYDSPIYKVRVKVRKRINGVWNYRWVDIATVQY